MKTAEQTKLFKSAYSYRIVREKSSTYQISAEINSANSVYKHIKDIYKENDLDMGREYFIVLFCSHKTTIIGHSVISQGGITGTVVDARLVFATALQVSSCTSIIVCHNHPSGNLSPSQADISITRTLAKAGELLGIQLKDHLIITENGFISLYNDGHI